MFEAEDEGDVAMLRQLLPSTVEHLAEASAGAQGPHGLTLRFGPGLPPPGDVQWFQRAYKHHPRVAVLISAAQAAYKAIVWMFERLANLPWLGGDGARRGEDAIQPFVAPVMPQRAVQDGAAARGVAVVKRPRSAFERWTDPEALEKWALTYVRPVPHAP